MHLLLSNDDGVTSEGISSLYQALRHDCRISVVAPLVEHSGQSSSLTLDKPLYMQELVNGFIALDGTPADCVIMALSGILDNDIEQVVSGINLGANLADDILYSGTIAAAFEGRNLRLPSLSFSLVSDDSNNMPTAAYFASKICKLSIELEDLQGLVLNVNIPDLPINDIKGMQITKLGNRMRIPYKKPIKSVNPRSKKGYWLPIAGRPILNEGTDLKAINDGFISITPLQMDCTNYDAFSILHNKLKTLA